MGSRYACRPGPRATTRVECHPSHPSMRRFTESQVAVVCGEESL